MDSVIAYARAWDRVLAEWDTGRLDVLYPPGHMMPFRAVRKLNDWSMAQGETKQQELIGMSTGRSDQKARARADASYIATQNALATERAFEDES